MAKDKKKKSKKDDIAHDLLDTAALSLKKFRKVTKQINKLSTGQKVAGGLALLAGGLVYLAQQQSSDGSDNSSAPPADDAKPTETGEAKPPVASRKSRKSADF